MPYTARMDISLPGLLQAYPSADIAKVVKIDQDSVRAWKRGNAFPHPARMKPLARFLKLPLSELGEIVARDRRRYKDAKKAAAETVAVGAR